MIFPRKLKCIPGVITSSLVARLLTMIIIVQFVVTSELCVSNIEVTINTCTCTDAFTVIATKNQAGYIHM